MVTRQSSWSIAACQVLLVMVSLFLPAAIKITPVISHTHP